MPAFLYNYSAAFIQFSKGSSLEEVSLALAIPVETLTNRAKAEGWQKLAVQLNADRGVVGRSNDRFEIIQANRARNLDIAQKLQQHLAKVADDLIAGTLKVPRLLKDGSVVNMDPSPSDYASLGAYSKSVSEMSYRAVGDVLVAAPEGQAASQTPNQIIINLPGAITAPRDARSYDPQTDILPQPAQAGGSGRNPTVIDAEVVEPKGVEAK